MKRSAARLRLCYNGMKRVEMMNWAQPVLVSEGRLCIIEKARGERPSFNEQRGPTTVF